MKKYYILFMFVAYSSCYCMNEEFSQEFEYVLVDRELLQELAISKVDLHGSGFDSDLDSWLACRSDEEKEDIKSVLDGYAACLINNEKFNDFYEIYKKYCNYFTIVSLNKACFIKTGCFLDNIQKNTNKEWANQIEQFINRYKPEVLRRFHLERLVKKVSDGFVSDIRYPS